MTDAYKCTICLYEKSRNFIFQYTLLALNLTKKNSKNTLPLGNKENGQY